MSTAVTKVESGLAKVLGGQSGVEQVKLALAKGVSQEAFARAALTAVTKQPKLRQCSNVSIAMALMDCGQVGLLPDGRNAHLVPYKSECKLVVDYKGYITRGYQTGQVRKWRAELVCKNDKFVYDAAKGVVTEHEYDPFSDRGEPIGAYSYVELATGAVDYEIMSKKEIMAIKKRSAAGRSGPWTHEQDQWEMWKKCPIRRHAKRLPLGDEFRKLEEKDFDVPTDITDSVSVGPPEISVADAEPVARDEAPAPEPGPVPEGAPVSKPEDDDIPYDGEPEPKPEPPPEPPKKQKRASKLQKLEGPFDPTGERDE